MLGFDLDRDGAGVGDQKEVRNVFSRFSSEFLCSLRSLFQTLSANRKAAQSIDFRTVDAQIGNCQAHRLEQIQA